MSSAQEKLQKPRSQKRRRAALVAVRLHPNELAELRQAAAQRQVSVSEVIRSAALRSARHPTA